jgi:hypothetical protein
MPGRAHLTNFNPYNSEDKDQEPGHQPSAEGKCYGAGSECVSSHFQRFIFQISTQYVNYTFSRYVFFQRSLGGFLLDFLCLSNMNFI